MKSKDLYKMCKNGDSQAWTYVYNRILKIAKSPKWNLRDEPEDLANDIFIHLHENAFDKVKDKGIAFKSFIYRATVNKILDSFRKRQIATRSIDSPDEHKEQLYLKHNNNKSDSEKSLIQKDLINNIYKKISTLPEHCKEVLPYYFDYKIGVYESFKELSIILGKAVGTLSSQINRCIKLIREITEINTWIED